MIVIVTTGASCVGELLKVNNSLQELDISSNPIHDDGVSAVADGLQCNNTLTKLNVNQCGFSVKGTVVNNFYYGRKPNRFNFKVGVTHDRPLHMVNKARLGCHDKGNIIQSSNLS